MRNEVNLGVGPPYSWTELKNLVTAGKIPLAYQEARIARVAFERPDIVAFGTTSSIASASSVSPTTVARLARSLGFANFRELKIVFREHLRERALGNPPSR